MAYENSIFRIWGEKNGNLESLGTGFAISKDLVMTALHVVRKPGREGL